jgi:hypothetical protein
VLKNRQQNSHSAYITILLSVDRYCNRSNDNCPNSEESGHEISGNLYFAAFFYIEVRISNINENLIAEILT